MTEEKFLIPIKDKRIRLEKCKSATTLYILGTGNFGCIVHHALKSYGINADYFLDLNPKNVGKSINGVPVQKIKDISPNSHVIIASNRNNHTFLEQLIDKYKEVTSDHADFVLNDLDLNGLSTDWSEEKSKEEIRLYLYARNRMKIFGEKLKLKSIDIVLTEKCTLKCVDCSNLMQYYQKPVSVSHEMLLQNISLILSSVDEVNEVRLIGGEPLIYRKIDEVINEINKFKNVEVIVVFTNGTLIPNDKTIEASKCTNIRYQISDYGKISRRTEQLIRVLRENNLSYVHEIVRRWQDCAKLDYQDRTPEKHFEVYSNCCVNDVLTLLHGRLYGCPFSAHIDNLKACPEFPEDNIELDLVNSEQLIEKITSLLANDRYYSACQFCNGRDYTVDAVPAAVQTKKVLEFKTHQRKSCGSSIL